MLPAYFMIKLLLQVWDSLTRKPLLTLNGHTQRVAAIAWNDNLFASGSGDSAIIQRDIRPPPTSVGRTFGGHRDEVCCLKWSPEAKLLASGDDDNELFLWNEYLNVTPKCSTLLEVNMKKEHKRRSQKNRTVF